jgi:hypothetical protein
MGNKTVLSAMALIDKVQTTLDGGCRITLDLAANEVNLAQELLKIKLEQGRVFVAFQKVDEAAKDDFGLNKRLEEL